MGDDVEIITVNTYDGTMESLEVMVITLKLKSQDYHFDIEKKRMYIHSLDLILEPGDCYYSKQKPQKFEAI
jgi:hypothetical protein